MADDSIEITVLADGTIRSVTDPISAPNHATADKFFKLLEEMSGVKQERQRRSKQHVHHHEHKHEEL